ncbi:MAG: hypothetical protein HFI49_03200 [Bacilli bacterium]|jgi:hypothetical protein|nr:hypothetical protein [Bacilli bacterium]
MRIVKNIQNFLMDQDYYIDIFNNCLHVYYYEELITLTDTLIELKLKEFNLIAEGESLIVSGMDNREILIKGKINLLRFNR